MEELGAIIRNLLERSQAIHSEIIFSQGDRLEPANTIPESAKLPAVQKDHDLSKLYDKLKLTQRETEVLELLIEGRSNIEIGQQLHLSPRTIEKYVSSLLRKSDLNNRIELICYAMEYHTS
jgi:DNA-binding NarL/FixJ family response regulator